MQAVAVYIHCAADAALAFSLLRISSAVMTLAQVMALNHAVDDSGTGPRLVVDNTKPKTKG